MCYPEQDHHGTMSREPYKENKSKKDQASNGDVQDGREMIARMEADT